MTTQLKNDDVELTECTSVGSSCRILTGPKMFLIPTTPPLVERQGIHSSSDVVFIKNIKCPMFTAVGETVSQC